MLDLEWEEPETSSYTGHYSGSSPVRVTNKRRTFLVHVEGPVILGGFAAVYREGEWQISSPGAEKARISLIEEVYQVAMPVWPQIVGRVRMVQGGGV